LGEFVYTKTQRIRRHDEIRDFVSKKLATKREKIQIIEEAFIPTLTGNLNPDVVVVNQGRVHVVNMTIHHEVIWMKDIGAKWRRTLQSSRYWQPSYKFNEARSYRLWLEQATTFQRLQVTRCGKFISMTAGPA
jgi:hypothetical protein